MRVLYSKYTNFYSKFYFQIEKFTFLYFLTALTSVFGYAFINKRDYSNQIFVLLRKADKNFGREKNL